MMVFEWPMQVENCAICGENNVHKISKKGQFGEIVNVVLCKNDGFVYLSPRWNQEGYDNYYGQKYSSIFPQFDNQEEVIEEPYKLVVKRINLYFKNTPLNALSIGAGKGCVLRLLEKENENLDCYVIEPSEECRNYLFENFGYRILSDSINSEWQKGNEKKFDIIIVRHVLEHLLDPLNSLKKVRETLTHSGVAYIAVPDMMSPKGSLRRYYFRAPHVSYFSKPTLSYFLNKSGLEIIEVREDEGELWCLVKRGIVDSIKNVNIDNFSKQLDVIKKYKKTQRIPELKSFVARLIGRE